MKKIIVTVLLSLLLLSCGNSNSFKKGDTVYVSEQCIGAINEDSYMKMNNLCRRRDAKGLQIMENDGLIKILNSGKSGSVVDMSFGKVKIRLDNGSEYWCASEFIE